MTRRFPLVVQALLFLVVGCGKSSNTGLTLTAIQLTPATPSVARGATQQLVATGTFGNGSTEDVTSAVTWTATPGTGSATVSNAAGSQGLVTGTAVGGVSISATLQGITSNIVSLTVTPATLVSIAVTPVLQMVKRGKLSPASKAKIDAKANRILHKGK